MIHGFTIKKFKFNFKVSFLEAYQVHKKIQEAVMAVEIYKLKSAASSSMWDAEIINGLDELSKLRQTLATSPNSAGQIKISKV